MHALPLEGVQIDGKSRYQSLALTGLHLGDTPTMERCSTHDLNVVVPLSEHPLGRLSHRRKRLDHQIVEALSVGESLSELGRLCLQLLIVELLECGLERVDFSCELFEISEVFAFADAKEFVEKGHGISCYRSTVDSRSVQADEPFTDGEHDGLVAGTEPQLVEDVPHMVLDRVLGDEQFLADLA